MTRDEIIKGLEKEIRRIHREPKRMMLGIFVTVDEAEDIVSILKEQEAVKPDYSPYYQEWYCGNCGKMIQRAYNYCNCCGREVKWE